ncbi:pantetheinase-like isoform X1 [Dreissena polymorpha]|uniref:CN hydrolase domain-containing protein n=1 Tax=Dreissena polymorpha TaxID=45954 RepID=A0A9D4MCN7_DREPO|nr:pantetheinase-like isoform X1 [Dreissena polymorpha]KAH3874940.1 hypothetical protein DPMN_038197 [Dreissena polymorpha]
MFLELRLSISIDRKNNIMEQNCLTKYFKTLFVCSLFCSTQCLKTDKKKFFTAAVYEHAVYQPPVTPLPLPRAQALEIMMTNIRVYQEQTKIAALKGANIIVFPEDGIFGMFLRTRELLFPFMEYIPEPELSWNPCEHPTMYPETEIQLALSCMARDNNIYLVANIGDKQPCNVLTDPSCPHTGYYQYNTNVAYDTRGTLVAKYHKYNLFYEFQFDKPSKPDISVFSTPFGRFGLFTCFDVLFEHPPIDLICRHNISNIAFPTAWMDAGPFFTSVQFHSAFAVGLGINFLAANIHLPSWRFHGSGIYTPQGAAGYYYNTRNDSGGQLIVREIPVVDQPRLEACRGLNISLSDLTDQMLGLDKTVNNERETLQHTKRKGQGKEHNKGHGKRHGKGQGKGKRKGQGKGQGKGHGKGQRKGKGLGKGKGQRKGQGKGQGSISQHDINDEMQHGFHVDMFQYDLFYDRFNLVPLRSEGVNTSVCHTDLCCHISYSLEPKNRPAMEYQTQTANGIDRAGQHSTHPFNKAEDSEEVEVVTANSENKRAAYDEEFYALGAFDGLHVYEGRYYIQLCTVIRCRKQLNVVNCSDEMGEEFSMRLNHFELIGNFSSSYLYPEILLQGENDFRLTEYPRIWSFTDGHLIVNEYLSSPLAVATLFGRDYGRDYIEGIN